MPELLHPSTQTGLHNRITALASSFDEMKAIGGGCDLTITAVSVVVAVLVGGIEALGLLGDKLEFKGAFWTAIGALNDNMNILGFAIIALFITAWIGSMLLYRYKGLDDVEVHPAEG